MTKVFISHKSEDERIAMWIFATLKGRSVDAYIDKLDPLVNAAKGEELGEYFRRQLQQCTHLMAVVSEKTKLSWWVPFEIGIATEREYPLATFADQGDNFRSYPSLYRPNFDLPDYLKKWPYLQTITDLDSYIRVLRTMQTVAEFSESVGQRRSYTKDFYISLRGYLGQK